MSGHIGGSISDRLPEQINAATNQSELIKPRPDDGIIPKYSVHFRL
jgi:hypothetical protein